MNKQTIWTVAIIVIVLLIIFLMRKSIKNIIRNFRIRGSDAFGNGAFGSARTGHTHQGIDIIANEGDVITAPFPLEFIRTARPYAEDINYTGGVYNFEDGEMRLYYIRPITTQKHFDTGEIIGYAQNISAKYSTPSKKMTNHVHLEIRDKRGNLINPTTYV
jgi:hypothetical protein